MLSPTTQYKTRTKEALDAFLNTLSYVPPDKLTWSPTPTAKNALQITAHCAGYSGFFAAIIRANAFPWSPEEFRAEVDSAIESITTLEEAETALRQGIADSLAALDTVLPEQIEGSIDAPHAQVPFTFFLNLPASHLEGHKAQLDYLQTCWDDQVIHLTPSQRGAD